MKKLQTAFIAAWLCLSMSANVNASENKTYSYDARGRLIKVERSGAVNNGVKTEYQNDKANNRKKVKTTGA